jgi:prepilin-type N-terminal cleavage/methylation domain-containing protein
MTTRSPDIGPRRPPRRAFSLLELVVVMVIIATVASIALPRYGLALDGYRVRLAAKRINADLELARGRAVSLSVSQSVSFSVHPALSQYQLVGPVEPDLLAVAETTRLDVAPYEVRIVAADFGGDAVLQFNGHGVPDTGGFVTIQSGAHQETVTVASPLDAVAAD